MKYRKKPVVIEAIQWTGKNPLEISAWANKRFSRTRDNYLIIETLEGSHYAKKGDWIIKGVKGEFYPCKPNIFEMTYEKVKNLINYKK